MWEVNERLIRSKSRQFRKGRPHQPGDFRSDRVVCAYCDVCIPNIVYFPNHCTPVTNVGFAKYKLHCQLGCTQMNGRCKARVDIVTDLVRGNLIHFPERIGNFF